VANVAHLGVAMLSMEKSVVLFGTPSNVTNFVSRHNFDENKTSGDETCLRILM
jgi:hypothetical protein